MEAELTPRENRFAETIQQQTFRINELYNECEHYKAEYQNAHDINAELMQRVEDLEHEIENQHRVMQEMKSDKIRADMFRLLEEYVHDDVDLTDIGKAVVSYHDLLVWEACHGDD